MPGIYANITSNGRASAPIGPMLSAVAYCDLHEDEHFTVQEAALSSVSPKWGGSCLFAGQGHESGDAAVLAGEIYDLADHREWLRSQGFSLIADSPAELCFRAFKAFGRSFFAGVNGKFALAVWEAAPRRLTLIGDRFGLHPIYYFHKPDGILLASEIKALLASGEIRAKPCEHAIATFFAFRQLTGHPTMIEGVSRLPPAGWLSYRLEDNRLLLETYWEARVLAQSGSRELGTADALSHISDAFAASLRRCTVDTAGLGISLSAGLDSRTIMGGVSPAVPLTCVTLGIDGGMDLRLCERLARLAGRPFHRCILDAEFLRNWGRHLRRIVELTSGNGTESAITVPTIDLYRELGVRVLLRGHGGELMHMDRAYHCSLDAEALALGEEDALEAWAVRHLAPGLFGEPQLEFLTTRYQPLVEPAARSAVRDLISQSESVTPFAHRLWLLFIAYYLPSVASSLAQFEIVARTRVPYVDADLIAALFSASPLLKLGDRIQGDLLQRHAPRLREIIDSNTGAPIGAGPARQAVAHFFKRGLAKLGVRGYQPYERLGLWLRREERDFVEDILLGQRCLDRGVFNREVVRRVIDDHASKHKNHTFLIAAMLNFEIAQREFIDSEPQPANEESQAAVA
jgi:asparagine synthetase B (glutamine-hydrolysing)